MFFLFFGYSGVNSKTRSETVRVSFKSTNKRKEEKRFVLF